MAQEQRAQQRRDVLPVAVRIRQDADLVIAQARQIGGGRLDADRDADVVHLLGLQHLARVGLPGVQDLAAQRHDRLSHAVARLLGRAAGRIALDQKQLAARRILAHAVGELARQRRRPRPMRLRATFWLSLKRCCALAIASMAIFSP